MHSHVHVASTHVATPHSSAAHSSTSHLSSHLATHLASAHLAAAAVATTSTTTVASATLLLVHTAALHLLVSAALALGDEGRGAGVPTLLRLWQSHPALKPRHCTQRGTARSPMAALARAKKTRVHENPDIKLVASGLCFRVSPFSARQSK